ncbi:hypothetical protein HOD96_02015 [Candidatus Falkowbacteria bacterium]|jgi:hypothetical protein|nr:hypothetical protein [Candidatus Falkowbacteria bacterium]MBT4433065.1 hypothetical protein [Candidatus Falkowbacteria bacterium]
MRKTAIFILTFVISIFVLSENVSAIGIISQPVAIKDALRGEVIQEELMVLNTNKEESDYDLIAEGDIAKWVKFYLPEDLESPITQVQIPAKAYFKIVTQFFVPEDAPNKEYSGKLTVTSVPSEKEESSAQISVKQQLSREVSIVVTDREIVNLNASIIPHRYGLETNETLNIRVIYDNQGNVSLNPQIQVKIKKDGEVVSNAIYPYPDEEPSVKPGSRYEIPQLEIQTGNLEGGKYIAKIDVLRNNESILKKDFKFSIGLNEAAVGSVKGVSIVNSNITMGLIIFLSGLAFLAVIIAMFIFIKKTNKKLIK